MVVKWKKVDLSESFFGFGTARSRSGDTVKMISQTSGLSSWVNGNNAVQ